LAIVDPLRIYFYLIFKTWSFPAKAGSWMGHAFTALRGAEAYGSAEIN